MDLAEGFINFKDRAISGRDQDAFTGMGEDAGGEVKLFLGLLELGDVGEGHDHLAQVPLAIPFRERIHQHPGPVVDARIGNAQNQT